MNRGTGDKRGQNDFCPFGGKTARNGGQKGHTPLGCVPLSPRDAARNSRLFGQAGKFTNLNANNACFVTCHGLVSIPRTTQHDREIEMQATTKINGIIHNLSWSPRGDQVNAKIQDRVLARAWKNPQGYWNAEVQTPSKPVEFPVQNSPSAVAALQCAIEFYA